MAHTVLRYAAFTTDPGAGNPAGVWIGDVLPGGTEMQRIAAEIGYSETVFLAPSTGTNWAVRYFTPEVEVPFCGHATIAAGVVLGERGGACRHQFATAAGEITVDVMETGGRIEAALTSVSPRQEPVTTAVMAEVLASLRWGADQLDPLIPPMRIFAGIWHLVIGAGSADRLSRLDYDVERLTAVMSRERLDTLQLVWRERADLFHSRNPCPSVGVPEDPATGSAAAALGGYLRDRGLVTTPAAITVLQGEAMGRPSTIRVEIPEAGGIVVRGTAVPIQ
jgi:PhzF family phenazine biosynthesis protein